MTHGMKPLRMVAFTSLAWLAAGSTMFAWSELGHDGIAGLAQQKLTPATTKVVNKILGNQSMASVASWADWIRLGEVTKLAGGAAEEADVEAALPGSDTWHFVDLPLGVTEYSSTAPSAGANDVVSGINKCIAILEGPDSSTAGGYDMHAIALKMLIHLVGDIHQPFHVACRYYRLGPVGANTYVTDPVVVVQENARDDRGANDLITAPPSNELHALWDAQMVDEIDPDNLIKTPEQAADRPKDIQQIVAFLSPKLAGNYRIGDNHYHQWAARWATDAIPVAQRAYVGIEVSGTLVANTTPGHETDIAPVAISNFDPGTYISNHRADAQEQLLKAAGRLADLLNSIHWHK
jgi:hypothetical protein